MVVVHRKFAGTPHSSLGHVWEEHGLLRPAMDRLPNEHAYGKHTRFEVWFDTFLEGKTMDDNR